jgi:hypothetical protein
MSSTFVDSKQALVTSSVPSASRQVKPYNPARDAGVRGVHARVVAAG